jgi:hypothetical protein
MRSMALMNEMGDLTITWDADKDDEMAVIIQKKLDQGIRFFIIEPFNNAQMTQIRTLADIKGRQISVPDEDIEKLFTEGKVGIFKRLAGTVMNTVTTSANAKQIAQSHTVGVSQFRGG